MGTPPLQAINQPDRASELRLVSLDAELAAKPDPRLREDEHRLGALSRVDGLLSRLQIQAHRARRPSSARHLSSAGADWLRR